MAIVYNVISLCLNICKETAALQVIIGKSILLYNFEIRYVRPHPKCLGKRVIRFALYIGFNICFNMNFFICFACAAWYIST